MPLKVGSQWFTLSCVDASLPLVAVSISASKVVYKDLQ